jgi:hypothetical protein
MVSSYRYPVSPVILPTTWPLAISNSGYCSIATHTSVIFYRPLVHCGITLAGPKYIARRNCIILLGIGRVWAIVLITILIPKSISDTNNHITVYIKFDPGEDWLRIALGIVIPNKGCWLA